MRVERTGARAPWRGDCAGVCVVAYVVPGAVDRGSVFHEAAAALVRVLADGESAEGRLDIVLAL